MKMIAALLSLTAFLVPLAESTLQRSAVTQQSAVAQHSAVVQESTVALSPIGKVLNMLDNLKAKIVKEEKEQWLLYDQETAAFDKNLKAKTWLMEKDEMRILEEEGIIEDEKAKLVKFVSKADQLRFAIAKNEQELKKLTKNYESESAHAQAKLQELSDTITMIQAATAALQKKGSASLLQSNGTMNIVQALGAMVQASVLNSADAERLAELMKATHGRADADAKEEWDITVTTTEPNIGGDPATWPKPPKKDCSRTLCTTDTCPDGKSRRQIGDDCCACEVVIFPKQRGDVISALSDIEDDATQQRNDAMTKMKLAGQAFKRTEFALSDLIKNDKAELEELKKTTGWHEEEKARAEHDLFAISKTLSIDKDAVKMSKEEFALATETFKENSALRKEELKALSAARYALSQASETSAGVSFIQVKSQAHNRGSDMDYQLVHFVRDLGNKHQSKVLMQLSYRMANVIRHSAASGQDPFEKVKTLITEMIARLEREAGKEATKADYCGTEEKKYEKIKTDKEEEFDKADAKLTKKTAELNNAANMVQALAEGAAMAAESHAKESALRQALHNEYLQNKADDSAGVEAVKNALNIISDYYAKNKVSDAETKTGADSIIALLEVIQSDLEKSLAALDATETQQEQQWMQSEQEYKMQGMQNTNDQHLYSTTKSTLTTEVSEAQAEKDGILQELQTNHETMVALRKECELPTKSYEEKVAALKAEKAGLEDALETLEGENVPQTLLLQDGTTHRSLKRSLRGGSQK